MGNKREQHRVVLQAEMRAHLPGYLEDSIKGLAEQRGRPEKRTYLQGEQQDCCGPGETRELSNGGSRCECKTVGFDDDGKW